MNRLHLCSALIFGAALALPQTSHAQPLPPATEAFAPDEGDLIKVRNVNSELLAYWLDPLHNPMPTLLQNSKSNGAGVWSSWTRVCENISGEIYPQKLRSSSPSVFGEFYTLSFC